MHKIRLYSNSPETREMSSTLMKEKYERGVEIDRRSGASSIDGLGVLYAWDTQLECRASGAPLWAWEFGSTSWQQAPCIFLWCPLKRRSEIHSESTNAIKKAVTVFHNSDNFAAK